MPRIEAIKNSFTAGEISPNLLGRTDLAKYHNACEKISNFIVRYQGGISRRWGSRYIADAMGPSRLIPFVVSPTLTYILEFGNQTLRFYTNDGQIQVSGVAYQITTPYNTATDDLWDLKYVQIASIMYIVHPNHAPMKLIRNTDTSWQLITPAFYAAPATRQDQDISGGTISISISGTTITASATVFIAGDIGRAIIAGTGRGYISAISGTTSTDAITGAKLYPIATITITDPFDLTSYTAGNWKLRGGPSSYFATGTFNSSNNTWVGSRKLSFGTPVSVRSATGYPRDSSYQQVIGTSTVFVTYTGGFTDVFRTADVGKYVPFAGGYGLITVVTNSTTATVVILTTPSITDISAQGEPIISPTPPGGWQLETVEFSDSNAPRAVTLFGDRVYFGSTPNNPQTFWGSGVGDYENFALGTLDAAGIRFTLNSGLLENILWMEVYQGSIVAGTFRGEYIINGGAGQAVQSAGAPITPTNINTIRQSLFGNSRVQPILVENDLLFIQRSKQKLYQFAFNPLTSSYGSRDLTILQEIITTSGFKEMVYQETPFKIIWFVDLDGNLVGLTYQKDQDVWAWHRHFTGTDGPDSYQSIAGIPAQNGSIDELWMVCKRLRNGVFVYTIELLDSALNVDSGSHTIFTTAVTSISGLAYLQGRTVYVVADGVLLPTKVMDATGTYTFPAGFSGKDVQAGLNYISEMQTVRPEPRLTIQGLVKRWLKVWVRMYQSLNVSIGTIVQQPVPFRTSAIQLDQAVPVFTGDVNINNFGYDRDGRIDIQQTMPLPCNILSIFGNLEISDGI